MKVTIIGGGAAGCFAAANLKRLSPSLEVTVLEAGRKPLAKVAVTGGGRCNLTNTFDSISDLREAYPRGDKLMRRLFTVFGPEETRRWFENEGVRLVEQDDGCIFPASQDAMEIVRTLESLMRRLGVGVRTSFRVREILPEGSGYRVVPAGGESVLTDVVAVMTGGGPSSFLSPLGIEIIPPVPSLFTFNIGDALLKERMGLVISETVLSIPGTKFRSSGTLLITDWGLSGPGALKLSSYAARYLHENGYKAPLSVQWLGGMDLEGIRLQLEALQASHPRKLAASVHPVEIPSRLWTFLLGRSGFRPDQRWGETGKKGMNRLTETLYADRYRIEGRCAFKEEFVTCGGVALGAVSPKTLECKTRPGLFFAGEALDIDAITGGFNLQAAGTTGFIAAMGRSKKKKKTVSLSYDGQK